MDELTQIKLMVLGAWIILAVLTFGPSLGYSWLLDLRDRRQSRLRATVLEQLGPSPARDRVEVRVHGALLSRRSIVTLDMRACSHEEIWDTIARLSQSLPPHARLVVDGMTNRQLPVTLTVRTREALSRPQPSAAHA